VALPDLPFVLVSRVGALDEQRHRFRLDQQLILLISPSLAMSMPASA